jgi:hypothetical protein
VKISLVYPPRAYYYMPYLAPFFLAGYLEAETAHTTEVVDLNIEYFHYLWSPEFAAEACSHLAAGNRAQALLTEVVGAYGDAALRGLQDRATFGSSPDVRAFAALLQQAERSERVVDELSYAAGLLPTACGQWSSLLAGWDRSVVARFLRRRVETGAWDAVDAVGISVAYVTQLLPAVLLAREIKRRSPSTPVVIGGGAVTHLLPEIASDDSLWRYIDLAVPFEGEFLLARALDALDGTGPMPVTNVVRAERGRPRYRKNLLAVPRVTTTPPSFRDLRPAYPTPDPIYPLLTSKGCYWGKCAFCTHHEGYGNGYYRLDDDTFRRSLIELTERGARAFYFVDEAIPPRQFATLAAIFEEVRSELPGGDTIAWTAEARLERSLVNEAAVDRLAASGCRLLVNGVESGSQALLDRMKKGIDLGLLSKYARLCSARPELRVGWMFFVGFPGETHEQARETFEFIARNARSIDFASAGVFGLERGSPVWNEPARYGVADILGRGDPYRVHFDFVMADGQTVTRADLLRELTALRQQHSELRPLFENAIDRALVLFFPPKAARTRPGASRTFAVASAVAGGTVAYSPEDRRLEVHRA